MRRMKVGDVVVLENDDHDDKCKCEYNENGEEIPYHIQQNGWYYSWRFGVVE